MIDLNKSINEMIEVIDVKSLLKNMNAAKKMKDQNVNRNKPKALRLERTSHITYTNYQ